MRGLRGQEWGSIELVHDGRVENLTLPVLGGGDEDGDRHEGGAEYFEENEEGGYFHGLRFNVVISGVFWVFSLLSFIGGDW